jgi:hypothetical protein
MEYINTYLDKIRVLLEKGGNEGLFRELTDEKRIESMILTDVKNVYGKFKAGKISEEDARKNLQLLKLYVISQLPRHRTKVLDFFDQKELPELDGEMIRRIVEFIEETQLKL